MLKLSMVNVLILGGGFGGVRTALELDKKLSGKEAKVTLVDKNNYHLFLPALYEVASAFGMAGDRYQVKLKRTIAIPYAEIFEDTKINFVQSEISQVDLNKKEAVSSGDKVFSYDYLVLALGAETETFNIKGVEEYAYKFKTIDEAVFLNQEITRVYKEAEAGKRPLPIKFLIAGAGFNGIELAAELACCTENLKKVCKLGNQCTSIKLIEAGPKILPMVSEREREIIRERIKSLGIEILEGSAIEEIGSDFAQIKGGERLPADFVIWTAGVRASSFLKNISGLKLDEKGKILVNEFMQAEGHDEVFGAGDNTVFVDSKIKKPIPGLAYVAADQGKVVAENILKTLIGEKKFSFYKPFYSVWIAPVGGKFAVAHLANWFTVTGFWGWLIREVVDFRYLASILPFSKAVSLMSKEMDVFTKND